MLDKKERIIITLAISISAIMLALAVICSGCKKQPAEQPQPEQHPKKQTQSEPIFESPRKPPKPTDITTSPKASLNDIIKTARTWGPAYKSWYGKPAPDFTLTDATGKQHTLSDYRGRNVMIVFWATWCPPCRMEIPHLIELRKTISQENLAMLAITNEKLELVKKFATSQKMNYTVLLEKGNMSEPFGFMRVYRTSGVPCSFFIDPDGKIKLATAGLISLDEIKDILKAK